MEHPDLSSYNLPKQINFIGNSCQELGITLDTLQQLMPPTTTNDSVSVTLSLNNGSILELDQVRLKQKLTYQQFLDIVSHLSCENPETENFDLEQFKYELKKIKNSNDGFLRIEKSKTDQQKYASFLKSPFSLPKIEKNVENTSLDTCLVLKSFKKKETFLVHKLEASASEISSLQGTVSMMEQCISEENTTRSQKEAEIKLLNKNLKISKKENEKINIKLSKKEDKLSKFNTRNINKRLNRSKQTNENIKKEKKYLETQLLEVQGNLLEVQDQFRKYKKENENLRKKISYWKNRTLKLENQSSEKHIKEITSLKIKELKQVIKYMESEKCLLKEKIVDYENKKLTIFQKGQYSNKVRAAYQDLVSDGGVNANKVEKVVNIVLTKIAGVQVDRLPKSTYAKDMGIEVRGMAQYHVASELSAESECQNMTLHSDGTTKFGHSYTTFDVQKSDGKLLVVGMREVGAKC